MASDPVFIWEREFIAPSGDMKRLRIFCGDICAAQEDYDVVVCSAFKDNYIPLRGTLVGALKSDCGIDVAELARTPEIDLRAMGSWLSRETGGKFRRLACVELIDRNNPLTRKYQDGIMLKGAFSTLRFILERANLCGIPVRSVILPVLGAGNQRVETCYIVGPLAHQCLHALNAIDGLECITFCERSEDKARELARCLEQILTPENALPDIFLSYSSRQMDTAYLLRNALRDQGMRCWMAPDSIPAGSSYQEEIPNALGNAALVALLLTPEAEQSRWVQKEIGMAVGSGRVIVPYQPFEYPMSKQFQFLLDGEQIIFAWRYPPESRINTFTQMIRDKLKER